MEVAPAQQVHAAQGIDLAGDQAIAGAPELHFRQRRADGLECGTHRRQRGLQCLDEPIQNVLPAMPPALPVAAAQQLPLKFGRRFQGKAFAREPLKLAMQEVGLGSEWVRAPRLPLAGAEREAVLTLIRKGVAERPPLP